MKRMFGHRSHKPEAMGEVELEAERGRVLIEESRELVVVLDEQDRVISASRRARETLPDLEQGDVLPPHLLENREIVAVPYGLDGRKERLLYLRDTGDLAAYEELRSGFTAAVSHELRTPLARLLSLLETGLLPETNIHELIEQATAEVAQIGELIDDVLFLSELESGREVVTFGATSALPIIREVAVELADSAARAGVTLVTEGDEQIELPLRPRMIRVIVSNLTENAIRHAGPGTTCTISVEREADAVTLTVSDDGVGVGETDLARLFERFYRADRARASRGTGLGLAIVKHVVASAGGTVEALGKRGEGLTIRSAFPR